MARSGSPARPWAALASVLPFSTEGVDFDLCSWSSSSTSGKREKQHASAIIGIASLGLPAHLRLRQLPHPPRWSASLWHCCSAVPSRPKKARRQNEQDPVHPDHRRLRGGRPCSPAFCPFWCSGSRGGKGPEVVEYLGHVLPAAIFGMLIVYCLRASASPRAARHPGGHRHRRDRCAP